MGVEGGLAAAGLCQFLHGAVPHDGRKGDAECGISAVKELLHDGIGCGEVLAHANFLGSLSGEE